MPLNRANVYFAAVGAAFGTSKAGIGIAGLGSFKPELIMKVRLLHVRSADHRVLKPNMTVPHSSRYVWYYCSIWFGSVGSHCRRT